MDSVAIVIPIYNEAEGIAELVNRLNQVLPQLVERTDCRFRVVLVDDGSRDDGPQLLKSLTTWNFDAVLLELSRNFGKEAAITAGLGAVEADAAVIMDADLQHPPELIEEFLRHWRSGYDVVYTVKADRKREGRLKRVFTSVFYRLLNAGSRFSIPADAGDFRLMSRRTIDVLLSLPESERFMKGLYAWVGFKQKGIAYHADDRVAGSSSFSAWRLLRLSIEGVTSFTVAPLRMMSIFGLLVAILSFLYLTYIIVERLAWGNEIPGFASVIVLISFFGGVQILCLGLIGEYVGKSLLEAKNRPQFVVASRTELR